MLECTGEDCGKIHGLDLLWGSGLLMFHTSKQDLRGVSPLELEAAFWYEKKEVFV